MEEAHTHRGVLDMLNKTVQSLSEKNMNTEALACLEQSLGLKEKMFGAENSVVRKTFKDVVLSCNSIAMQYLAEARYDKCLELLRKAEALTTSGRYKFSESLRVLTFNNLGCCYRRLGKLKVALKYLNEAAKIGVCSRTISNLSITHLNICAIQSELGRHEIALEHAQAAVFHCQEELVSLEVDGDDDLLLEDVLEAKTKEEKMITMAISYHNLAVEMEFTGNLDTSLEWYKKALQIVGKQRETQANLFNSFKIAYSRARKQYQEDSNRKGRRVPKRPVQKNTKRPQRPTSAFATRGSSASAKKSRPKSSKLKRDASTNNKSRVWRDNRPSKIDVGRVKPQGFYKNLGSSATDSPDTSSLSDGIFQGSPVRAAFHKQRLREQDTKTNNLPLPPFSDFIRAKPPIAEIVLSDTLDSPSEPVEITQEILAHHNATYAEGEVSRDQYDIKELSMNAKSCLEQFNACLKKPEEMSQVDYLRHIREATLQMNQTIDKLLINQKKNHEEVPDIRIHQLPTGFSLEGAQTSKTIDHEECESQLSDDEKNVIDEIPILATSSYTEEPGEEQDILASIDRFMEEIDEIHTIAVIRLQACTRGLLVRRNSALRERLVSNEDERQKNAAAKIQSQNRQHIHRKNRMVKKLREIERQEIHFIAAKFIQACARGFLSRRRERIRCQAERELIIKQKDEVQYIAAMHIQALVRGFLIRNRVDRYIATEIARGFVLQMHMMRELRHAEAIENVAVDEFKAREEVEAATKIQAHVRRSRDQQAYFIELQRRDAARRQMHEAEKHLEYEAKERAATSIQAQVRGRQARMLYEYEVVGREALQEHMAHDAASKIQARIRGRQDRLCFEAEVASRHAAAEKLQGLCLGYNVRKSLKEEREVEFQVEHIAASTIQGYIRKNKNDRIEREVENIAAITIQSYLRRRYSERMPVYTIAATLIQSVMRRYLAQCYRDRMLQCRIEIAQWGAAIAIQSIFRGQKARQAFAVLKQKKSQEKTQSRGRIKSQWLRSKKNQPHVQSKSDTEPKKRRFPWRRVMPSSKGKKTVKPSLENSPSLDTSSSIENAALSRSKATEKPFTSSCSLDTLSSGETANLSPTPPRSPRSSPVVSPRSQLSWLASSTTTCTLGDTDDFDLIPKRVKLLYDAFKRTPDFIDGRKETMDISIIRSLGLDFSAFKQEFQVSTDSEAISSALDGMIVLVGENEKLQSVSHLTELGNLIEKKMNQDSWDRDVALSSCWLLYQYDHLLQD